MVRVYLTGGLHVDGPEGSFHDAAFPGVQARVAFTTLTAERRPIARDELAELVWDGDLPAQWNAALTTVISKIRSLMSGVGLPGREIVTSGGAACAIAWPAGFWIDLEDAQWRLDRAEGALRDGAFDVAAREATVASAVYRRPILAGVANGWVDDRRRLHGEALYRCLTVLAEAWSELGNHALAATIADRAIRHDPLRELAYRLLIAAELGRGDHGAARYTFERCESMLHDELGVAPSSATVALIDRARLIGRD